ncbi:MAG: 4-hydroxythreonine-4-phosphate dehydrogenase PdxA [Clostridiales bacterium]|nr:4-hydroxythreonine-4-phosphate dehydrogenase PdxA [Clostridiales bacterium]
MLSKLLLTIGDPAGIGPEVTVKALARPETHAGCVPVVIGDKEPVEKAMALTRSPLKLRLLDDADSARGGSDELELLDINALGGRNYEIGKVSALCGEAAFKYVTSAIALSIAGKAAGVVTAPINKEALHLAGHMYSGHTEIFAEYTHTRDYAMLLMSGNMRVIHVTTHVSMRRACELIQAPRVYRTIALAHEALKMLGIPNGRIAVAGLNPHSSENGLFGNEETEAIIPAITQARAAGIDAEGPVPPDTVFVKAAGGMYDMVVAMYHDQGHIPLKLYGFRVDPSTGQFTSVSGINTTVGLPIIRTSVDHGTAFDRAGKNTSNEMSMVEAVTTAVRMIPYYEAKKHA